MAHRKEPGALADPGWSTLAVIGFLGGVALFVPTVLIRSPEGGGFLGPSLLLDWLLDRPPLAVVYGALPAGAAAVIVRNHRLVAALSVAVGTALGLFVSVLLYANWWWNSLT